MSLRKVTERTQLDQHQARLRIGWQRCILIVAGPADGISIQSDCFFKARPRNDSLFVQDPAVFLALVDSNSNRRLEYFSRADLATRGPAISFLTPARVALADLFIAFFFGMYPS